MALPEHLKIGLRGEQLTANFLRRRKYKIVEANYLTRLGETDIIALSPKGVLCFIEVKTRSPGQLLPPAEAVDRRKEENIKSNAAAFMKARKMENMPYRFDIAEVILHDLHNADINHIENAF